MEALVIVFMTVVGIRNINVLITITIIVRGTSMRILNIKYIKICGLMIIIMTLI